MGEAGLEAIFMASRPMLLRFMRARLGDHQEAEDLLQDLWLKLRDLETGPIAEPRSYLFRMADNLVLDRRRSSHRRARRDEAWTEAQSGAAIEIDDRPSPEQTLLARERLRIIERVLHELPERTATAFRMFRIEEKPQKLIAAEFGVTVSAIEKHLQKAYRAVFAAQASLNADWEESRRPQGLEGTDVTG
jgi:RNA polymerase sigma-70 factor (ECF subfamily)